MTDDRRQPEEQSSYDPDLQGKRVKAVFYRTEAGGEPVRDWLRSLSADDRKRIGEDIKTVEFGWPLGMPVCRSLSAGIYEVRSDLGRNRIARVLFYFDKSGRMVLLHGFIKKRQKTPDEELGVGAAKQEETREVYVKPRRRNGRTSHTGSTFDSFLEEEGIREQVEAVALKRVISWQLGEAMKKKKKTKQTLAKELRTSRSQLDRLLDPQNIAVSLESITRAATVLGKRLVIRLADAKSG